MSFSIVTYEISDTGLTSDADFAPTTFSSKTIGTCSVFCDTTEPLRNEASSLLVAGSRMVGMVDEDVGGRCNSEVSSPPDCPGPSDSSLIQLSFCCLADDPLDEELEGAAVCRVQAEVRAASLSSSGVLIERTMSCGVSFSDTVMKWTATRAGAGVSVTLICQFTKDVCTLEQSRGPLRHVLYQHLTATVQ